MIFCSGWSFCQASISSHISRFHPQHQKQFICTNHEGRLSRKFCFFELYLLHLTFLLTKWMLYLPHSLPCSVFSIKSTYNGNTLRTECLHGVIKKGKTPSVKVCLKVHICVSVTGSENCTSPASQSSRTLILCGLSLRWTLKAVVVENRARYSPREALTLQVSLSKGVPPVLGVCAVATPTSQSGTSVISVSQL